MMGTNAAYDVDRVGFFTPKMTQIDELGPGEIGFITAAIKEVADTRVGDTITDDRKPVTRDAAGLPARDPGGVLRPVPGRRRRFRERCARRWASCASTTRASRSRWKPRRRSASASAAASSACLHLEIIQERLQREFDLNLIATAPSVIYKMHADRRTGDRDSQSGRHARRGEDRRDRGAVDRGHHPRRPTNISAAC